MGLEAPDKKTDTGTLGALLYADPNRPCTPESEWTTLVRAVAQGDQIALRGLYDRANRLVFTLALRITGSRESADEITVDVFLGVWQRAASYDPACGTVVAWIMNLARSRSIDRLRHEQRSKRVSANALDPTEKTVESDCAARQVVQDAEAARLRLAVATLPRLERAAIEAAYFRDLSYSEVATQSGEPLGTVKTRIRAGLARLRKLFAPP